MDNAPIDRRYAVSLLTLWPEDARWLRRDDRRRRMWAVSWEDTAHVLLG